MHWIRTAASALVAIAILSSPIFAAEPVRIASNDRPAVSRATDVAVRPELPKTSQQAEQTQPCRWWHFGHCGDASSDVEGLPPDAPKAATLITVDTATNTLYLFREGQLVAKGPVATGTEKTLTKGSKMWMFHTPRGRLKVLRKIDDPVWRKPDWAFVEKGERIPPPDSPRRLVKGHLGKYALDLGDGIMIHGTDEIDSLGRKASHGCVRVGSELLEEVYGSAGVGTDVYIF